MREGSDFLRIFLVLFFLVFDDVLFYASAAAAALGLGRRGRWGRGVQWCLLRLAIGTHMHLVGLLFLHLAFEADCVLFLPGVGGKGLLVLRGGLLDFRKALLDFRILGGSR